MYTTRLSRVPMFQHFNCIFKFNLGFWNYVRCKFQLYYVLLCYCRMELSIMSCVSWHVYSRCQATLGRPTGRWSVVLCIGCYGLRVGVGAECFGAYMRWCLSWCQCEITRASANWQQYIQYKEPQLLAFQMSHQRFLTFQGAKYVDLCHLWGSLYSDMHCVQYWMHMCVHIAPNEYVRVGFMSPASGIVSHSFRSQPQGPVSNCQPSGNPPTFVTQAAWDFMISS